LCMSTLLVCILTWFLFFTFFFFQAEDGIRDFHVTGVQTCALPIWKASGSKALTLPTATNVYLARSTWTYRKERRWLWLVRREEGSRLWWILYRVLWMLPAALFCSMASTYAT